jgi:hypothetical protein
LKRKFWIFAFLAVAVFGAVALPASAQAEAAGAQNFFIAARAGFSFFMKPDLAVDRSFDLYGETGSLNEQYKMGSAPAFEIQFGKYFGGIKAGFGVTYWSHKQPGTFLASLPHPFLSDTPRTVGFEDADLKNPTWNIYAFALFTLVDGDPLRVLAGPMIGLTKGEFQALDDFNFSEKAPFAAADVTISETAYVEDQYTELLFGGLLSLEYRLSPAISLLLDARMIYLNPKIPTLGRRANLLQVQPVLGIQINF